MNRSALSEKTVSALFLGSSSEPPVEATLTTSIISRIRPLSITAAAMSSAMKFNKSRATICYNSTTVTLITSFPPVPLSHFDTISNGNMENNVLIDHYRWSSCLQSSIMIRAPVFPFKNETYGGLTGECTCGITDLDPNEIWEFEYFSLVTPTPDMTVGSEALDHGPRRKTKYEMSGRIALGAYSYAVV